MKVENRKSFKGLKAPKDLNNLGRLDVRQIKQRGARRSDEPLSLLYYKALFNLLELYVLGLSLLLTTLATCLLLAALLCTLSLLLCIQILRC